MYYYVLKNTNCPFHHLNFFYTLTVSKNLLQSFQNTQWVRLKETQNDRRSIVVCNVMSNHSVISIGFCARPIVTNIRLGTAILAETSEKSSASSYLVNEFHQASICSMAKRVRCRIDC
jgi:hypothetical protein